MKKKIKKKGPVGINLPKPLNATNAMVLIYLNDLKDQHYHLWLNSLFISHKFFFYL